jgi:hypothetical protein
MILLIILCVGDWGCARVRSFVHVCLRECERMFMVLWYGIYHTIYVSYFLVCYGTANGFSLSGSQMFHYQRMRKRYTGCTFLHGNLEITHLESRKGMTFDLSFLETIEVVTGYVLIFNNDVDVIPLTNLVHVRGETQFSYKGNNYAFSVILSDNRGGIQMPMLKGKCCV